MKKINSVKLSMARNAEHYQFNEDILGVITADFATAQKIEALRTEYADLFSKEDSIYAQTRALAGTAEIEAKDAARDKLSHYIIQMITAKLYSYVEAEELAAGRLKLALTPYWDAHKRPYAENTALATNMTEDMLNADNAADTETLGLTEAANRLKAANEEFKTVYGDRSDAKGARELNDKMKDIRPQVDTAYRALVNAINVLYQSNALVAQDETVEAALSAVIDKVNARILQLNETISLRTARAATASAKKSKSTE